MQRAFTLVEILMTIAVIAILAVLTVPALQVARERARSANCMANLKALATAFTMYADGHNGVMPPSLDNLANGIYLPEDSPSLDDPKTGQRYAYHPTASAWQSSLQAVIVEDPSDLHLGARNQLMSDGSIRRWKP